jgi:Tol biopolymer transport system component
LDGYGTRIGRELHALRERAIEPFDAVAIAHAVAVAHPGSVRLVPVARGPGRQRWLLLAVLALTTALLAVLWIGVGQRTPAPSTFAPSSIAFLRAGDLYVAKADGSEPVMVASGDAGHGQEIFQFAFAPDRQSIAFTSIAFTRDAELTGTRLEIRSPDGTTIGSYTADRWETQFAWAPDSRRLVLLGDADDSVIVGLDGGPIAEVALPPGWMTTYVMATEWASWSPDGKWIAVPGCSQPCDPKHDLSFLLVAADGSASRPPDTSQTGPSGPGSSLAWAPDSRYAVLRNPTASGQSGPSSVDILSTDGTTLRHVDLAAGSYVGHAAWSPDGIRLGIAGLAGQERQLILVDTDGTVIQVATDPAAIGHEVAWSRDGRSLLDLRLTAPSTTGPLHGALWLIDAEGGDARLLLDDLDAFDLASQ